MNKMLRPLLVGLMDMLVSNLIIDRFRDIRHEFEGVKVHMEAVLGTSITFQLSINGYDNGDPKKGSQDKYLGQMRRAVNWFEEQVDILDGLAAELQERP